MSILGAIVFFLPAGAGNMAPILVAKVPGLSRWQTPLDFGKSWRDIRIFGTNKTWRGLVSGTVVGALVALILHGTGLYDASLIRTAAIGAALGFGGLVGDAVESFFKRRLHIQSGSSWFPFDQTDYIIGGLLFVAPLKQLSASDIISIFVSFFLLHLLSSYIGYLLKFKSKPI